MRWDERQRKMLAAMGVRLWSPAEPAAPAPPVTTARPTAPATAAKPVAAEAAAGPVSTARLAATPIAPKPIAATPPAVVARAPGYPASPSSVGIPAVEALAARMKTVEPPGVAPSPSDPVLAERAAAIATLAWEPLKDAVAACTACDLCASRRNTVFGVGHARAHWMIIGEAPGEKEDLAGEPFVGPAGQLLDQMLRAVGQSRRADGAMSADTQDDEAAGDPARRVYIANTLKCRPPRNRNPEPDEMARCEPFLKRQVALVQPKLILAMGRFAVRQLLKSDEAIGKLRGRVHRYEGIPVVVTYHPAYLLRNLPDKAKAWEDLCLAKQLAPSLLPSLPPEGEPG